MISISHAPNSTSRQRRLASTFLLPWTWPFWRRGKAVAQLEASFASRFNATAASFSTGREALFAVLNALGIGHGDEVIIQAYTCIVVPHAVIWTGATPRYSDIDATFNIDAPRLESLITPQTKAVIVQHTFGMPADMPSIMAICKKRNILCIEDCAHALGASVAGREVGAWGDAAIFSFGRDKIISGVAGGVAIIHKASAAPRLLALHEAAKPRPRSWIFQNLMHAIFMPGLSRLISIPVLGTLLIRTAQTLRIVNKVYTPHERESLPPKTRMHRLPNAMAALALQQLQQDLAKFSGHRQQIAQWYASWAGKSQIKTQGLTPLAQPANLRFTILTPKHAKIIQQARKYGFILGDWYCHIITPRPLDSVNLGYAPGSCPQAEQAAKSSLNLPTNHTLTLADAQRLTSTIDLLL